MSPLPSLSTPARPHKPFWPPTRGARTSSWPLTQGLKTSYFERRRKTRGRACSRSIPFGWGWRDEGRNAPVGMTLPCLLHPPLNYHFPIRDEIPPPRFPALVLLLLGGGGEDEEEAGGELVPSTILSSSSSSSPSARGNTAFRRLIRSAASF